MKVDESREYRHRIQSVRNPMRIARIADKKTVLRSISGITGNSNAVPKISIENSTDKKMVFGNGKIRDKMRYRSVFDCSFSAPHSKETRKQCRKGEKLQH